MFNTPFKNNIPVALRLKYYIYYISLFSNYNFILQIQTVLILLLLYVSILTANAFKLIHIFQILQNVFYNIIMTINLLLKYLCQCRPINHSQRRVLSTDEFRRKMVPFSNCTQYDLILLSVFEILAFIQPSLVPFSHIFSSLSNLYLNILFLS